MNSFSLRSYSKKFHINASKHSLSRNSKNSLTNDSDDISSSRPPKRGRLSSKSHKNATKFTALFDFKGYSEDELNFRKGDQIHVISQDETSRTNWWKGRTGGKEGIFPSMYVAQKNWGLTQKEINPNDISLQEFIGKGGFATVRRGLWRSEEVAVKIIRDITSDGDARKEATVFWLLRHPNIISLLGICNRPPDFWLVMEYARGGSLAQVLSNTLLPLKVIIDWSAQIARAMKYLHQDAPLDTIIHRDLKSKNILISESLSDGRLENKTLKISDFGLARQALNTIHSVEFAGTFEWMAPEVFKSKEISTKSDVWSFGVVLWEMLTSQVPYKNLNQYQIVYGVGNNILRLPIPRSCPQPFERLLQRCWNIDPKERPPFSEILNDLQDMQRSVRLHDEESFAALQLEWKDEVEEEMETIRSESVNTMNNTDGGMNQMQLDSYLEGMVEGLRQVYANLERSQMNILQKELYFAVKEFNDAKKHRKRLNIFSWRKKHSLKIGQPSNFQHNLHAIIEETSISPRLSPNIPFPRPFTMKTIRVTTNSSQGDVQNMSTENIHPAKEVYSVFSALQEVTRIATCILAPSETSHSPILTKSRESLLPSSPASRPTTLGIKAIYQPSQGIENGGEIPSNGDQKISPFKVKIVQMESKSKVYVTGNNPEDSDYLRQSIFRANDENQIPSSRGSRQSNNFMSTISTSSPLKQSDTSRPFSKGITLYGSLSTLKSLENQSVASKISHKHPDMFPYDKVGKRQSWLHLNQGKSVAELRAFFSQKINHNKSTVN